jgi:hypothetical protein
MDHNQNSFAPEAAVAGAADEPSATSSNLSAASADAPPTILDFDPVALRARFDGWTPEKQRAFIEELADCGIVREAAARVGMTEQSAARLRRRTDAAAFSLAWDAALRIGGDRLRSIAWERAVMGVAKPRFYRGEKIGEERIYDNRLLTSLVAALPAPVDRPQVREVIDNWDRWMEAIEDRFYEPPPLPDEADDAPVWREEDGTWWTSYPPPPDFASDQHGRHGDKGYRRVCSGEERMIIQAMQAREEQEEHRLRDVYFSRLNEFSTPRGPNL